MKHADKLKKKLCEEIDSFAEKPELRGSDIDTLYKLASTVKNIDKISGGYSQAYIGSPYGGNPYGVHSYDGNSYAGASNAHPMHSMDDPYSANYSERRRYSRDGGKDHMMHQLGEMMRGADEHQRHILERAMRQLEEA